MKSIVDARCVSTKAMAASAAFGLARHALKPGPPKP